ncbi:hypothetical protein SAMN04488056_10358 [Cohaesibacter marisflavi]|uniref:Uncharacterized protein n=1 Tax=Cohaesibacter marisflavi TaxID=655353 RepID=A0A1I5E6V2_9HYPH|nr:hypothetical protein SAMN04488056_10358 [Cohaesibacter marisflavi]
MLQNLIDLTTKAVLAPLSKGEAGVETVGEVREVRRAVTPSLSAQASGHLVGWLEKCTYCQ